MPDDAFALGTYDAGQGSYPGLVVAGKVHDISAFTGYGPTRETLEDGAAACAARAAAAASPPVPGVDESALTTLPPVTRPGQLYAAGANYRTHIIEMAVA